MPHPALAPLLLSGSLLATAPAPPAAAPGSAAPTFAAQAPAAAAPAAAPLPSWAAVRKARIARLLGPAMARAGVDAWLVLCRENANDPLAEHVGGENAGGTAALLFVREGERVRSVAVSPEGEVTALREVGLHDVVESLPRGADLFARVAAHLGGVKGRIALNASPDSPVADGLSSTQRAALERALPAGVRRRLVSSEELVAEWLSVKLPEEVEVLRVAARLTARLEEEAYRQVVPGRTRDSDVARFLKRRMAEEGVGDAWAPEQNPNVNSGPDRGHSHATDRVIRPGDFIQTDFGVRVHGRWVTDIQRFAYVLAPGETAPPPEALERWRKARQGNRVALAALRPGARGWDVDAAQRAWMRSAGSAPVMWGTGHPVGYWAHDAGPALSGAQKGQPAQGANARRVQPGQVFAFDGFFAWALPEGGTKTLSVEEMALVTPEGAEYLVPPQEELILIPSR